MLGFSELNGSPRLNPFQIGCAPLLMVSDTQSLYQADHELRGRRR